MQYLSQIINKPVFDKKGDRIGKIVDIVAHLGTDSANVIAFCILTKGKEKRIVSWECIEKIEKKQIFIGDKIQDVSLIPEDLLLVEHILDKRIIDTRRKKISRVSDVELEEKGRKFLVSAVDAGMKGILRRFGFRIPGLSKRIPWSELEPLEAEFRNVYDKLSKMHPADIADIVEELGPQQGKELLEHLSKETAAETMTELAPEFQATIVETLHPEIAADILEEMPADDAADVLLELPKEKVGEILKEVEKEEKEDIESLLKHNGDTAGGIMNTDFISLNEDMTAEETIQYLRQLAPDAETFYYLYVVDKEEQLIGVLTLRHLIVAKPETKLKEIMITPVVSVNLDAEIKEVADLIAKYNLLALPVISEKTNKLEGVVTVDDVVEEIVPRVWKKKWMKRS